MEDSFDFQFKLKYNRSFSLYFTLKEDINSRLFLLFIKVKPIHTGIVAIKKLIQAKEKIMIVCFGILI